jgi:hypothetical protein
MFRQIASASVLLASLVTLSLPAQVPTTPASPTPVESDQNDPESLARTLIACKSQRRHLAASNPADPRLPDLDRQIALLQDRLASQVAPPALPEIPQAPILPNYPRIAVLPALPSSPAPTAATPSSQSHSSLAGLTPIDTPEDLAARLRLDQRLSLTVQNQPLEQVFAYLAQSTGVPIRPNWIALEAAGIDRKSPVTVDLQNLPAHRLLTIFLREAGGMHANLGYLLEDGMLIVATRDHLQSSIYQVVRIYDARNFVLPGNEAFAATLAPDALYAFRQMQVARLTDCIKSVVSPDTWRDNGGTIGSIQQLDSILIISQTRDNHHQIEQLLTQLRALR